MSFADILQSLEKDERRKLDAKVPSWRGVEIEVPASINQQQCSGETAARYKASLLPEGARVADLTGGLGVDSWSFSRTAAVVWYNERDAVLLEAVKRNFAVLGVSNVLFNGFDIGPGAADWQDALRVFAPDVIYLDPARRDSAGRKVFLLEDCSPDVLALMPQLLSIAPLVMVKVSPMADITMLQRRLSGWITEIHVVGADGECKELLCLCRRGASFDGIVLTENGATIRSERPRSVAPSESFLERASGQALHRQQGAELLFVPSAAMVKSGLGPGVCLMPFDEDLAHFGKYYQVLENLPFASAVIKDLGKRFPQAEVSSKGLPVSSDELRAKLRTKPGGPVHIIACTLGGEKRILVCENLPETRKRVEVVAAIIRRGDRVFATQRGYGEWKDWWEWPGGKMEDEETPETALAREIREELDTEISIDKFLYTVEWDYPKFHLTMHCYMCSLLSEALHLNEHEAARWLGREDLRSVKWLPADELLFPYIENELL